MQMASSDRCSNFLMKDNVTSENLFSRNHSSPSGLTAVSLCLEHDLMHMHEQTSRHI